MNSKVNISAVIITFNEERNIGRCITSLQLVADEILVLDSFSIDNTASIAKSLGARVEFNAFDGHIQQKNRAVDMALYEVVLSLDADEALSETLQEAINKVKSDFSSEAYEMNRLTNYCGSWVRHSGWYPDSKVRLWKKGYGYWGGVNPHDKVILNPHLSPKKLVGDLLHYSYYTPEDHYRQIEYFSKIAARELFGQKVSVSISMKYLKVLAQWVKTYVLKAGFLDKKTGWDIARRSAYATYRKYSILEKLHADK